jgi:hypothetical protein
MTVDPKAHELAEHVLADRKLSPNARAIHVEQLAKVIQATVEEFLFVFDDTADSTGLRDDLDSSLRGELTRATSGDRSAPKWTDEQKQYWREQWRAHYEGMHGNDDV